MTFNHNLARLNLDTRHECGLVRVRAAPAHHRSDAINDRLAELERASLETGNVTVEPEDNADVGSNTMERAMQTDRASGGPPDTPF